MPGSKHAGSIGSSGMGTGIKVRRNGVYYFVGLGTIILLVYIMRCGIWRVFGKGLSGCEEVSHKINFENVIEPL